MLSHYEQVLDELRKRTEKLATEYVTELYLILRDEEELPPDKCRSKIEHDCGDMWKEDTIRRYLPEEAKNPVKRKAGKISAELRKKKKKVKERKESKLLAATAGDAGQYSAVLDSVSASNAGDRNNSVGIDPIENCPVGQKKQESSTFQQAADVCDNDYFSLLLTDRLKDEALEIMEDPLMVGDEIVGKSLLLLPPELAEQIYAEVNATHTRDLLIPEFELEHNGIKIVSVRKVPQ